MDAILQNSSIAKQCNDISEFCNKVFDKRVLYSDFCRGFPLLIQNIFGITQGGWLDPALSSKDAELVRNTLSPRSSLFKVIFSHINDDNYGYTFPLKNVPAAIQASISGNRADLSRLYTQKMLSSTGAPVFALTLNIFEYFMFNFALFATSDNMPRPGSGRTSKGKIARRQSVLDDLWGLFAPVKVEKSSSSTNKSNSYQALLLDYLYYFYPVEGGKEVASPPSGPEKPRPTAVPPTELSYKFLLILTELWMNQNPSTLLRPETSDRKSFVIPTPTLLEGCNHLVRHLVGYTYANVADKTTAFSPVKSPLRSSVDSVTASFNFGSPPTPPKTTRAPSFLLPLPIIQKPLYHFLKINLTHLPKEAELPRVPIPLHTLLDILWLSYITPWTYMTKDLPNLHSVNPPRYSTRKGSTNLAEFSSPEFTDEWKSHVEKNFAFYTVLLAKFMKAAPYFDYDIRQSDVMVMHKVLTAYSVALVQVIKAQEGSLPFALQMNSSNLPHSKSVLEGFNKLREHWFSLEGQPFPYSSPFDGTLTHDITEIMRALRMSLDHLGMQPIASSKTEGRSASLAQESVVLRREEAFYIHLIKDLGGLFEVPVGPFIQDPVRKEMQLLVYSPDLAPERDLKTGLLTQAGRAQIKNGERKCSPADTKYLGDWNLRPITSDEIGVFVKLLHKASVYLNKQPLAREYFNRAYRLLPKNVDAEDRDVTLRYLAQKHVSVMVIIVLTLSYLVNLILSCF